MDVIIVPIINLLITIIGFFKLLIIARVILSWLDMFNIVNRNSQVLSMINNFIYRATEPALGFVRQFIPNLGTIDLSPLVILLGSHFLQEILARLATHFV